MPLLAASDPVELAKGLVWPLLIAVVVWKLFPAIRGVIESRGFTVRIGGAEISVQQASDQIAAQLDDLRAQVSAVKAGAAAAPGGDPASGNGTAGAQSPITAGVPELSQVLWVDDHPENNAFEMAALRRQGVDVTTAHTTEEAMRLVDTRGPWDAVITDVGRDEQGRFRPDAGLELAARLREHDADLPVVIYTSAPTLARVRADEAVTAGAGATASGTELLDILGRLGCGKAGAQEAGAGAAP